MAAVPITINGIQTDEMGSRNVTIVGMASLTGLAPGHPLPPAGAGDAHPEHPIVYPPQIWPSPGRPAHPIVIPEPPTGPPPHVEHPIVLPPDQGGGPPPDASWVWGWNLQQGWHPVYVPPEGSMAPH